MRSQLVTLSLNMWTITRDKYLMLSPFLIFDVQFTQHALEDPLVVALHPFLTSLCVSNTGWWPGRTPRGLALMAAATCSCRYYKIICSNIWYSLPSFPTWLDGTKAGLPHQAQQGQAWLLPWRHGLVIVWACPRNTWWWWQAWKSLPALAQCFPFLPQKNIVLTTGSKW